MWSPQLHKKPFPDWKALDMSLWWLAISGSNSDESSSKSPSENDSGFSKCMICNWFFWKQLQSRPASFCNLRTHSLIDVLCQLLSWDVWGNTPYSCGIHHMHREGQSDSSQLITHAPTYLPKFAIAQWVGKPHDNLITNPRLHLLAVLASTYLFFCLWILATQENPCKWTRQPLFFCIWPITLSVVSSRFIQLSLVSGVPLLKAE